MTARQAKLKQQREARRARKIRGFLRTVEKLILIALAELATGYTLLLIRQPVIEVDGIGIFLMFVVGVFAAMYLFNPDKKEKPLR